MSNRITFDNNKIIRVGLKKSRYNGLKSNTQYQKILWVSQNIKPVEIIIINDNKTGVREKIRLS